jgi:uncharacterized protein (TIRG00374 family)
MRRLQGCADILTEISFSFRTFGTVTTEETTYNDDSLKQSLGWRKVLVPILIGLIAAGGLLWWNLRGVTFVQDPTSTKQRYDWVDTNSNGVPDTKDETEFVANDGGLYTKATTSELIADYTWPPGAWIALMGAVLMVILRDVGYIYRLRVLSDNVLSWKQSFQVTLLWEFASALTPSVVGGSGVAIYFLNREGMNLGKSTATIFVTAMMDEIFYILMVPLVILLIGTDNLFPQEALFEVVQPRTFKILFYAGYGFIVLLTLLILLGMFFLPEQTKKFLVGLFSFRLLRRWRHHVEKLGDEIIMSAAELRGKTIGYWSKAFGATIVSWTARFFTLNFIFLAFVGGFDQLVVYGRQLIMWVIMLISVTPGSSGVAELMLPAFFRDMPWSDPAIAPLLLVLVAVLWRLFTYFPYLFAGVLVLPSWIRRTA